MYENNMDDVVSIEKLSESLNLNAVSEAVKGGVLKISDIPNNAVSFFRGHVEAQGLSSRSRINTRAAERRLSKIGYVEMMDMVVTVPPGLNVSYLEYINRLEKATEGLQPIISDMLVPFNLWLANVLSNPAELSSNSLVDLKAFEPIAEEKIKKHVTGAFVKGGSDNSKQTFGKLVSRNKDWPKIVKESEALVESLELIAKTKKNDLMKLLSEMSDKLKLLFENIENNPSEYEIADPQLKIIADRTLACARAVELFSIVYYKAIGLHASIEMCNEAIEEKIA